MHIVSKLKQFATKASVAVATLGASALAMATPATPFDTAIASATTNVESYAGALVGLSAVAVVFMLAMKYVKKIPRAG